MRVCAAGNNSGLLDAFRKKLAAGEDETVPAAVVDSLLAGVSPVKVWREYRGLTQDALAAQAGISKAYLFDRDAQSEYLDFYMLHRIAGDTHGRIREDGRYEGLDVVSPFGPVRSSDPEEDARLRAEDEAEVERIRGILRTKGFPSCY